MSTRQTHNVAGGHISGGNLTVNNTVINAEVARELQLLYEKLKMTPGGDQSEGTFCEKLEHFMSAKTSGDVRGLEEKLKDSDRLDQLDHALMLKERVTKSIMRQQASRTAQRVYTIVLDSLHTSFVLTVTPLVQAGASRIDVDHKTLTVLQETKASLGENYLEFDQSDLLGFLYFLGGNCHIRWDKC